MKKLNYKEKGITLVALVITVIILLIIAGVTIGSITGENGLIAQARRSVDEYKKAELSEEEKLMQLSNMMALGNTVGTNPDTSQEGDIPQGDENGVVVERYQYIALKKPVVLYGEGANEELTGGWSGSFLASVKTAYTTYAITNNQIYFKKGDVLSADIIMLGHDRYQPVCTIGISKNSSVTDLAESASQRGSIYSQYYSYTYSLTIQEDGFYNVVVSQYNIAGTAVDGSKTIAVKYY